MINNKNRVMLNRLMSIVTMLFSNQKRTIPIQRVSQQRWIQNQTRQSQFIRIQKKYLRKNKQTNKFLSNLIIVIKLGLLKEQIQALYLKLHNLTLKLRQQLNKINNKLLITQEPLSSKRRNQFLKPTNQISRIKFINENTLLSLAITNIILQMFLITIITYSLN